MMTPFVSYQSCLLFELYISLYSLRHYSMCAAKCDVFCESRREVHVVKQALTGYFVCYKSATEARQV